MLCRPHPDLDAQQRYFPYRAILVAIVSRSSLVLVFMGYRPIVARYVAKWGIAQMRLCETKHQGLDFVRRRFGRLLWDAVDIGQNCRWTKCTEHASEKIRPSKRLERYIFQTWWGGLSHFFWGGVFKGGFLPGGGKSQ